MRIWKVKPGSEDDNEGENDGEEAKWTAVSVADFDQHKSVPLFLSFVYSFLTTLFL